MAKKKQPELEPPLAPTPTPNVPIFRRGAALGSALALGVTLASCGDDGEPPMVLRDTGTTFDTGTGDGSTDTGPPPPMPPPIDSGTLDATADGSTDASADGAADGAVDAAGDGSADAASDGSVPDTGPPPPMPPPPMPAP